MDKQNHYKQVYSNCNLQNSATITSIGPTVGKQFSFLWLHAKTIKGTYTTFLLQSNFELTMTQR